MNKEEIIKAIRRNTESSRCIDVYSKLLDEIQDETVVRTALGDMGKFITGFRTLCKEVDKVDDPSLRAKLLSTEFIDPQKYFKRFRQLCGTYWKVSKSRGLGFVLGERNRLGDIRNETSYLYSIFAQNETSEEIRKIILLWNYTPSIVKAIIQTKRREYGFDIGR